MFSRKFPSNHPNFVPDVAVTDTAAHYVESLISAGTQARLVVPLSGAALDGANVVAILSGRVNLYSGATAPELSVWIQSLANGVTRGVAGVSLVALPVSASGLVIPFSVCFNAVLDAKAQNLYGTHCSVIDPVNNQTFNWSPLVVTVDDPNQLQFIAVYQFAQAAPLSGTTVEITEFRFGA
jgi:hypothetical protein